jgi:putative ABC transport system permease protein
MLNNYLKMFFRNMFKYRTSSTVNITGLGIAIACCVFILLFVFDELKFDQFNDKKDRIYRYMEQSKATGETALIIPACNYPLITNDLPEIESGFRLHKAGQQVVGIGTKRFLEDIYFADNEILNVLTFPLLKGDPKTALKEPFSLVLTESLAKTYFGNDDPFGKTINLENENDYKVTGILKDIPFTSHINPSVIASISTFYTTQRSLMNDWHISSCYFYFLVKPHVSKELLLTKLTARVYEKYGEEWAKKGKVDLEPLPEIYLQPSRNAWDIAEHGDINIVRSFIVIAILILLMASFNYTNILTTSIKIREKEIAARKILGAGWKDIIKQLIFETFLYLIISLGFAAILIEFLLDEFNQLTGKQLTTNSLLSPEILLSVLGLLLFTAFFSILYPVNISLRRSTFNKGAGTPLVNQSNFSKYTFSFRQTVTGIQFIITIGLLICSVVIYNQLKYANNAKLGFNKEHLLTIENPWDEKMYERFESYRNKIIQYPQIVSVSASGNNPSENINNYTFFYQTGKSDKETIKSAQIAVDYDLLKTWQTKFLAGRNFSREITSDKDLSVIINRAAAKELGLSNPLNVELNGINNAVDGQKIIGVVEDIHFRSFKEKIMPIVFYLRSWSAGNIVVRVKGNNIASTVQMLENEWKKIMPDRPFVFNFIDESFDKLYQSERRTEKLIMIFSAFAIVISLLGLFGLISLISQIRKKDIGIRKVLGASVESIVFMITKEFILIVTAANVIAWPIAYYVMNKWLEDFAYRIELSWWMFALSGIIALLIALITVGYQAIKAAMANPVDSLKYE